MDIQDKVIVITGGASGLGRASADLLIESGAKVAIFDINDEAGDQAVTELGDACLYAHVDVTSEASVQEGIAKTLAGFGAIHGLINCAGSSSAIRTVGRNGPHPLDEFQRIIDLNLVGSFNVARLCAAQMIEQDAVNEDGEKGVIINTASIAGVEGQIGQVAYSASKAGVIGMTLTIARDMGKLGVRCNTIQPGVIKTPLMDLAPPEMQEAFAANTQFPRRLGHPSEYASLAKHLIENTYINGETIRLDAGSRHPAK